MYPAITYPPLNNHNNHGGTMQPEDDTPRLTDEQWEDSDE